MKPLRGHDLSVLADPLRFFENKARRKGGQLSEEGGGPSSSSPSLVLFAADGWAGSFAGGGVGEVFYPKGFGLVGQSPNETIRY